MLVELEHVAELKSEYNILTFILVKAVLALFLAHMTKKSFWDFLRELEWSRAGSCLFVG